MAELENAHTQALHACQMSTETAVSDALAAARAEWHAAECEAQRAAEKEHRERLTAAAAAVAELRCAVTVFSDDKTSIR
jgi:hypothetical protein